MRSETRLGEIHPEAIDVQTLHHYTELSGPNKID